MSACVCVQAVVAAVTPGREWTSSCSRGRCGRLGSVRCGQARSGLVVGMQLSVVGPGGRKSEICSGNSLLLFVCAALSSSNSDASAARCVVVDDAVGGGSDEGGLVEEEKRCSTSQHQRQHGRTPTKAKERRRDAWARVRTRLGQDLAPSRQAILAHQCPTPGSSRPRLRDPFGRWRCRSPAPPPGSVHTQARTQQI